MTTLADDESARPADAARPALLTFLIADVRGYTRFTVEHGDEAAAMLAHHFADLCEQVTASHSGRVIELRGDEALAVFASARDALRGAVALQEAFDQAAMETPSLPIKVGIGLDAGEAIPVKGGYRGGALNLAARLCSIAGGGEILASETVLGLARKTEGIVAVDRGQVTLKGLQTPARVLQIGAEGELPESLPPLQPVLVTHPTNLPDEPTPFIGRAAEIEEIVGLLRDPHHRLLTLTGPAGTGKTRLALQIAERLLHDFSDGAFLVSLGSLSDAALVPGTIAGVLGVQDDRGEGISQALAEHLKEKHVLLVLDNFEHLLPAAAGVASLLDSCRALSVLVTSRTPLHLSREREYPVAPLSVPVPGHLPATSAELSQYDAIALFVDRARSVRPDFVATDENAAALAGICTRLDGLPLAIELAAARIKLFPPQALLGRLSNRLKLLTGGASDRPSRQQTLRGAIDWSYSLLSEEEQLLFARLSVFQGGCTFEAAEEVCNADGDLDLLEGLTSLVDKSLVRQEGDDDPRFTMLETIREYAAERLAERDKAEAVHRAHAEHFLRLARSANLTNESEGEMRHPLITANENNIRAALEWTLESGQLELGLQIAAALENYWVTNRPEEGQRWLSEFLEQADGLPIELRAVALRARGAIAIIFAQFEEGEAHYEASLSLYRQAGDERGIGIMLMRRGFEAFRRGERREARSLVEEALELHRKTGFKKGQAQELTLLADIEAAEGRDDLAFELLERSATLCEETGFLWWRSNVLFRLVRLLLKHDRLSEAETECRELLALTVHMSDRQGIVYALATSAQVLVRTGRPARAGLAWGAIEAAEERGPLGQWELDRQQYLDALPAGSSDEFERGRVEGRGLSLNEAVTEALV